MRATHTPTPVSASIPAFDLSLPALAPQTVRPGITPPVTPPAHDRRRGQRTKPRSVPRPRPMRKPGGVR
jgi:hypothetical protein